jgi:hypothetical protein
MEEEMCELALNILCIYPPGIHYIFDGRFVTLLK